MEKITFVILLEAIQDNAISLVGAKALSLARMNRIGLAVPPGFCITEAGFRKHLELNNLIGHIKSALAQLRAAPPATSAILSDLRQAIIEAPMADMLRQQIENHHRELAAKRVAVRSSATAEDLPGH